MSVAVLSNPPFAPRDRGDPTRSVLEGCRTRVLVVVVHELNVVGVPRGQSDMVDVPGAVVADLAETASGRLKPLVIRIRIGDGLERLVAENADLSILG